MVVQVRSLDGGYIARLPQQDDSNFYISSNVLEIFKIEDHKKQDMRSCAYYCGYLRMF